MVGDYSHLTTFCMLSSHLSSQREIIQHENECVDGDIDCVQVECDESFPTILRPSGSF